MPQVDGQVHCTRCAKAVHDLSAMTRAQAWSFVDEHRGQPVCVRYRVDKRGEPEFAPSPIVRSTFAAVAALALSACAGYADPNEIESPAEGMMCEDVSGYTIPCVDQPPNPDAVEAVPAEPAAPTSEPGKPTEEAPPTISAHDVLPLPHWLDPTPTPTGEGCPLPTVDPDRGEIVGELPDRGPSTRRERARARRAYRREQRRDHHDRGMLKGKLVEF